MNRDVFLSILALDSYNRGYGANLDVAGNAIGNASILTFPGSVSAGWESAGFYAIAYVASNVSGFLPGGRVMSYRGTSVSLA